MPRSIVAIAKDPDPEKMVAEVFALLGGTENLIRPRSTVVLNRTPVTRPGPRPP